MPAYSGNRKTKPLTSRKVVCFVGEKSFIPPERHATAAALDALQVLPYGDLGFAYIKGIHLHAVYRPFILITINASHIKRAGGNKHHVARCRIRCHGGGSYDIEYECDLAGFHIQSGRIANISEKTTVKYISNERKDEIGKEKPIAVFFAVTKQRKGVFSLKKKSRPFS